MNKKIIFGLLLFLVSGMTILAQRNTVTDIQGNVYKTVRIGNQIWMAENLSTTFFNDKTPIQLVEIDPNWGNLTTPGYCYLFNDPKTYKNTFGVLYNWYTVETGKLCPVGWHVPSDEEWEILTMYLGGSDKAGAKLKIKSNNYWGYLYRGTNSSNFSALPGNWRTNNRFCSFPWNDIEWMNGRWWSSTENFLLNSNAFGRDLNCGSDGIGRYDLSKSYGCSVRCIKDNSFKRK